MLRRAFITLSWLVALGAAVLGALHGIRQAETTGITAIVTVVGSLLAIVIGSIAHKPPFVVSTTAAFSIAVITASGSLIRLTARVSLANETPLEYGVTTSPCTLRSGSAVKD